MSTKADVARLQRKLRQIKSYEVPAAAARAINRVVPRVARVVAQGVSRDTGVKISKLRSRFLKRFGRRASPSQPLARISVGVRDVSLAGQLSKAVVNQWLTATPTQRRRMRKVRWRTNTYERSWIMPGVQGVPQVFQRREGVARYPIDVVKIPIRASVDTHMRGAEVQKIYLPEFRKEYARELNYRIQKHARK